MVTPEWNAGQAVCAALLYFLLHPRIEGGGQYMFVIEHRQHFHFIVVAIDELWHRYASLLWDTLVLVYILYFPTAST